MTTAIQRSAAGPVNHPPGSVRAISSAEYAAIAAATLAGTFTPQFGLRYMLTDGLLAGRMLEWNGESFGGFATQTIIQTYETFSRSSANAAGDATPLVLDSIVLPGFLMRPNSKLRITSEWSYTGTVTSRVLGLKFGGADAMAPTIANTNLSSKTLTEITNANSYTAQRVFNSTSYASVANAQISMGIETRSPVVIDFLGRWSATASTEVITLVGFAIELVP